MSGTERTFELRTRAQLALPGPTVASAWIGVRSLSVEFVSLNLNRMPFSHDHITHNSHF